MYSSLWLDKKQQWINKINYNKWLIKEFLFVFHKIAID